MRKWNGVISGLMLVLFLVHAVAGALEIMGLYTGLNGFVSVIAWFLLITICLHVLIGIRLTAETIIACKKSGIFYKKENRLFLARRLSGLAIVLFMIIHIVIFRGIGSGVTYRLHYFGIAELITQIFLVISIAVHVITNIKPSLIALGIKSLKEYAVDLLVAVSIFLLFIGIAFFIYYLRWQL